MLVTKTREKAVKTAGIIETARTGKDESESGEYPKSFVRILYIRYLITFQKKFVPMLALFDSNSEVNIISLTFAQELRLSIRPTDVGVKKIDSTTLDTYVIKVTVFLVTDKANWVRFFEKIFLVTNICPEIVFRMLFLILNDADVNFLSRKLRCRTYTTKEALLTIKRIELVGKKEFAIAALDPENETFIVYVASLSSIVLPSSSSLDIYPFCRFQIVGLIAEEASTKVLNEYVNFAGVFSPNFVSKLSKYSKINDHAIKLVNS